MLEHGPTPLEKATLVVHLVSMQENNSNFAVPLRKEYSKLDEG